MTAVPIVAGVLSVLATTWTLLSGLHIVPYLPMLKLCAMLCIAGGVYALPRRIGHKPPSMERVLLSFGAVCLAMVLGVVLMHILTAHPLGAPIIPPVVADACSLISSIGFFALIIIYNRQPR